jgi:hypothetical protein
MLLTMGGFIGKGWARGGLRAEYRVKGGCGGCECGRGVGGV